MTDAIPFRNPEKENNQETSFPQKAHYTRQKMRNARYRYGKVRSVGSASSAETVSLNLRPNNGKLDRSVLDFNILSKKRKQQDFQGRLRDWQW